MTNCRSLSWENPYGRLYFQAQITELPSKDRRVRTTYQWEFEGEEIEPAREKAHAMGVKEVYIESLKEEFARDYVFPMFRANTIYEGEYLLGTSIARPLIAKRLVEIAHETGADAIAHGATGKGNDQVRFELGAYALNPDIKVIAPWREWDLTSRETLMAYAEKHGIPVEMKRGKKSPYSMDANSLHISYEGDILEDPWAEPEDDMWRWSVSPLLAVPAVPKPSTNRAPATPSKKSMKAPPMLMVNMNIRYMTARKTGIPSALLSITRSIRSERLRVASPFCSTVSLTRRCAKP